MLVNITPMAEEAHQLPPLFSTVPDVCNVESASDALGTTANFVRELLRKGELRGFKVGQHWRITRTALLEYVEAQEKALIESRGGLNGSHL